MPEVLVPKRLWMVEACGLRRKVAAPVGAVMTVDLSAWRNLYARWRSSKDLPADEHRMEWMWGPWPWWKTAGSQA